MDFRNLNADGKFFFNISGYEVFISVKCRVNFFQFCNDFCRIFGHSGDSADDLIYVNWLNMARAGLLALEFYSPDTQAWRQVCNKTLTRVPGMETCNKTFS